VSQTPPPYGGAPSSYPQAPEHPKATTVLVLGILGIVVCQVLSPFAWVMGNRAIREIDLAQGQIGGRGQVQAGRICGIVGTCLFGLNVLLAIFFVIFFFAADPTFVDSWGF